MSLIQVSNLTFGYEGSFDNVFENASFAIDTDWKCGFIGRNGRGKTTFLNLLRGKYSYSGTIAASVDFEYFPFEVDDPYMTPLDIAESIQPDFEQWRLSRELNLLDVDPDDIFYRPYCTLSYGERTKVLLAILFIRENSFLLIDEPTNHLDVAARDTLAKYLKTKRGFILVSHDRA
ncbi:MAG: ABC-F family ATP-binding cassette domain-containing protein, partial [Clostridia bacterium]|nr:ABC-F family ATP-binding cassette domain-containing protein [Clostridia bacterium]